MAVNIIHKQNVLPTINMVDLGPQIKWTTKYFDDKWKPYSMAKGNKYYMCACGGGAVAYSLDCKNWTKVDGRIDSSTQYHTMIFADGRFICVGNNGTLCYMKEPTDSLPTGAWEIKELTNTALVHIVYEPISKYYVCVGHSGTILYTQDITQSSGSWQSPRTINSIASISGAQLRHIIYVPELDKFVISGNNGIILYSSPQNINTWTQASHYNASESFQEVYYDSIHGLFIFTGSMNSYGHIVYTKSLTSFSWCVSPIETFERDHLQSTSYIANAGIYVTVGWNGTIFCTRELTNGWTRYYNNQLLYSLLQLTEEFPKNVNLQNIYYFEDAGGIVIVGPYYMVYGSELYEPIMSVDLLNMYKSMLITVGSITTKYQNNPSNYLGFGTWIETVNDGGTSYTYTYYNT